MVTSDPVRPTTMADVTVYQFHSSENRSPGGAAVGLIRLIPPVCRFNINDENIFKLQKLKTWEESLAKRQSD